MSIRSRGSVLALVLASASVAACDTPSSKTQTTSASTPPQLPPTVASSETPAHAVDWQSKLDPDMKVVIDALTSLDGKPIETLSAVEARKQPTPTDAVKKVLQTLGKSTKPEEVGKVEEKSIATAGGKIPLRVYSPKGKGPFPVVVYYHGGGWVLATDDTYDASARALTNGANAVVVSVEYRKAPENKFPAAHDDALAAYEWVLKNAATIDGDAKRIAVAGESAGGNLAANVAIAARDKHEQVPVHELLIYPVASGNLSSPSELANADAKPLDRAMMAWFTQQYFRTPADGNDPRIDLVAANLKGLPPTTIINAEVDPLLSDGEELAAKMRAAGVEVTQQTFTGVTHEFFGMGAVVAKAKQAETLGVNRLKAALGT